MKGSLHLHKGSQMPRILRYLLSALGAAVLVVLLVPAGPAQALREGTIYTLRPGVITNPAGPASATSMTVGYFTGEPITGVSWQLLDDTATVVLEKALPTPAPVNGTSTVVAQFTWNPTAAHGNVALPDGTYQLRMQFTDGTGSYVSGDRPVTLAFAPPAEPAVGGTNVSDVVPSARGNLKSVAQVNSTMPSGVGFGASVPDGVFTLKNAAGKVLRTSTLAPVCNGDGIFCIDEEHIYGGGEFSWTWDGKVKGKLQPAGRYQLSVQLADRFGRLVTHPLGPVYLRHLATLRAQTIWPAAEQVQPYRSVVGRCSSVATPGTRGWAGSIGLLSKSRCASSAGTADQVFQSFAIEHRAPFMDRVVTWRLDGYGAPVKAGMSGTLVMAVSSSSHTGPVWRRTAVLGNGLGWHLGKMNEIDPAIGSVLTHWAQARVTDGNRYDLRYIRTVFTYRGWVR